MGSSTIGKYTILKNNNNSDQLEIDKSTSGIDKFMVVNIVSAVKRNSWLVTIHYTVIWTLRYVWTCKLQGGNILVDQIWGLFTVH